jgi:hypothetical protein
MLSTASVSGCPTPQLLMVCPTVLGAILPVTVKPEHVSARAAFSLRLVTTLKC